MKRTPAPFDETNLSCNMSEWFDDFNVIQDYDHHEFAFFGLYGDLWHGVYYRNTINIVHRRDTHDTSEQYITDIITEQIQELNANSISNFCFDSTCKKTKDTIVLTFKFYYTNGSN